MMSEELPLQVYPSVMSGLIVTRPQKLPHRHVADHQAGHKHEKCFLHSPPVAVIGTSHHHHHCYKLWSRLHDLSIIPNWADLATMHCKCSRHDIFADKEVSLSTRCHASLSEANARDAQLISCLHYRQPPGKHTHTPSIAIAHTGGAAHKFAGE